MRAHAFVLAIILAGPAGAVIPPEIISRPPTAELAPGQKDSDSLPPYPVLDAILAEMLEKHAPREDIVANGFDRPTVDKVCRLLSRAEYKRRQAAPGPRISSAALARNTRMPMMNGFDPSMLEMLRSLADEWNGEYGD